MIPFLLRRERESEVIPYVASIHEIAGALGLTPEQVLAEGEARCARGDRGDGRRLCEGCVGTLEHGLHEGFYLSAPVAREPEAVIQTVAVSSALKTRKINEEAICEEAP